MSYADAYGLDCYDEPDWNYWETKDGEKIAVKDMSESHIKNCIRMLEKEINPEVEFDDELNYPYNAWLNVFRDELEERRNKNV